jgi:hypothetical protein
MLDYDMYFTPMRDGEGVAVLVPVLLSDEGNIRLSAGKVVTDVEKALSMYAGFTLAATVENAGGIEVLKNEVDKRAEKESEDDVHSSAE